ncbi:ATP synthase subunit epsilon [Bacteroidetes bacterium UKL13-3]|jgi:F-type H+-transporting ATPase subunit epsilon|nr:ATP synthase subunit epsilon [Bacteroidetes bacterium UKL13-3]HCP94510.1 ATP synthase F1 subunit epsilon [Bacteroidota bacterium]
MQLEILTPDKSLFSGNAEAVTFPGADGQFQILKDHAALVASLAKGDIRVKTTQGEELIAVNGGVVEVLNNTIIVLA